MGAESRPPLVLEPRLDRIDFVKDERTYGLFPEFRGLINSAVIAETCAKLQTVSDAVVQPIITEVPPEWTVDAATSVSLRRLIVGRAAYLVATLMQNLRASRDIGP